MEKQERYLLTLESGKLINTPEKNLRLKVESLVRNLEQLESKKSRLDYEIRKQRKSLVRKREELKRASKQMRTRDSAVFERHSVLDEVLIDQAFEEIKRWDSLLLQKSDQLLDQ